MGQFVLLKLTNFSSRLNNEDSKTYLTGGQSKTGAQIALHSFFFYHFSNDESNKSEWKAACLWRDDVVDTDKLRMANYKRSSVPLSLEIISSLLLLVSLAFHLDFSSIDSLSESHLLFPRVVENIGGAESLHPFFNLHTFRK